MNQQDGAAPQTAVMGILLGSAVGLAAAALTRRRLGRRLNRPQPLSALQSYLLDHLAGSDIAYALVERLCRDQAGTSVGALARRLQGEFGEERRVVMALLRTTGSSPRSLKRVVAAVQSAAFDAAGPTVAGERPVFLALEALAVGVQGKRLLWRVLQGHPLGGQWDFQRLETQALSQWQEIDAMRLGLAHALFEHH